MKIIVWPTTINFWMKVLLKVYRESFFFDLQIIVGKNKDWHYANQAEKSGINDMKKCHLCLKDYNSHMSYYPHQLKDTFLRVFCFHCLYNKPTSPKKILSKTSKKVTFLINCSNEVVWYNLQFWQQCLLLLSCKKKEVIFFCLSQEEFLEVAVKSRRVCPPCCCMHCEKIFCTVCFDVQVQERGPEKISFE